MKAIFVLILLSLPTVALAQNTTPEATQSIAQQIGMLVIQNANLADQIKQLQTQIIELRKKEAASAQQVPSPGAPNEGKK